MLIFVAPTKSGTKMAKIKELREKNNEELNKLLAEKEEIVRKLRFEIASKQIKNVKDLKNNKKEIARILTLINESK
jgi:large subunit ribosomal protein L29